MHSPAFKTLIAEKIATGADFIALYEYPTYLQGLFPDLVAIAGEEDSTVCQECGNPDYDASKEHWKHYIQYDQWFGKGKPIIVFGGYQEGMASVFGTSGVVFARKDKRNLSPAAERLFGAVNP